jgi:hypothetical protein
VLEIPVTAWKDKPIAVSFSRREVAYITDTGSSKYWFFEICFVIKFLGLKISLKGKAYLVKTYL